MTKLFHGACHYPELWPEAELARDEGRFRDAARSLDELMTKFPDQPWAYRKTLKEQLTKRPRSAIARSITIWPSRMPRVASAIGSLWSSPSTSTVNSPVMLPWPAAIVSSVLWGYTHNQYPLSLQALIAAMGIYFCWLTRRTQSLWTPYASHMVLDIVGDSLIG